MSKYDPLTARLAGHDGAEWRANFKELEEVLGFGLPKAAHSAKAWWHNTGAQPHQRAWTGAGWEVVDIDQAQGRVTFARKKAAAPASQSLQPSAMASDEPAILQRLDASPKWGAAMIFGSVAVVAGLGALAVARLRRR
jgi:hypothetical protein